MIKCLRQTHGTKFNSLFVQWTEKVKEKNILRNDKAQNHSIVRKLKSRTATTKKVHPLLQGEDYVLVLQMEIIELLIFG